MLPVVTFVIRSGEDYLTVDNDWIKNFSAARHFDLYPEAKKYADEASDYYERLTHSPLNAEILTISSLMAGNGYVFNGV